MDPICSGDSIRGSSGIDKCGAPTDRSIGFIFLLVMDYSFTYYSELLVAGGFPSNIWMLPYRIWFLLGLSYYI